MNKVLFFIVYYERKFNVFFGFDFLFGIFNFDWGKRSLYECEIFYILIYILKKKNFIIY